MNGLHKLYHSCSTISVCLCPKCIQDGWFGRKALYIDFGFFVLVLLVFGTLIKCALCMACGLLAQPSGLPT